MTFVRDHPVNGSDLRVAVPLGSQQQRDHLVVLALAQCLGGARHAIERLGPLVARTEIGRVGVEVHIVVGDAAATRVADRHSPHA